MKLKNFTLFFIGLIVGVFVTFLQQKKEPKKISELEIALGDFLYQELQKFPKKWSIEHINQRLQDLDNGHPRLQEKIKDGILLDLAAEVADLEANEHLKQAVTYLKSLTTQTDVEVIVPEKVYVQVLKKGEGETITCDDVVSLIYKQYDLDGSLLKQTPSIDIPLANMIKGFKLGVSGAKIGECRKIYIHPDYGFGKIGRGDRSNQLLIYEVTFVKKITT